MNPPPPFRPFQPSQPPAPFPSLPPPHLRHHHMPTTVFPSAHQHHHHYQQPTSSSPSSTTPTVDTHYSSAPDLPTALSTLTSLLQLTKDTLNSLSPLLRTTVPASAPSLIPCPFNPNHLLPPPSLFSHFLSCPSSPTPLSSHPLLHSLQYPHTLHSSSETPFTQPLENPNSSELCFSLENFLNFSNNFFYLNCPGPVIVNPPDNGTSHSPPLLTLPGVLSAECANFTSTNGSTEVMGFPVESIRLLPSEIWAVGDETNGWVNYPASYSYRVLRAILKLQISNLLSLRTWVILNSPKYGVIIDIAMRDHVVLLFKLCLKSVIREAVKFADLIFGGERHEEFGRDKRKFDCSVLVNVMMWLGAQLSILYGEVNGKFFAINMLKQCVFDSALNSSIFPVVEKATESSEPAELDGKLEGYTEIGGENDRKVIVDESMNDTVIFVSQVSAAVAALYERSWLQSKIKALRDTQPLTAFQRMREHEQISKIADNERQNRPNFRPVIEHDGLLWQQGQNQEQNRFKTREELLAEERDYKRRRMSYRGKKMKRSTTQVMRDIIDEYMEEIKQASNLAKGAEEVKPGGFESFSVHDSSFDTDEKRNQSAFGASRGRQHGYGENMHLHSHRPIDFEEKYHKDYNKHKHDCSQHHGYLESEKSIKRTRHDRKDYSRSPDRRRSGSHMQGLRSSRGKQDDPEMSGVAFSRSSDRSFSTSHMKRSHQRDEYQHDSVLRNQNTGKKLRDHQSYSSRTVFGDRYNPAESDDT